MASKTSMSTEQFDLEAEIDDLTNLLERTKVLYEQYFMGIQKRAPEVLHRQVERRMRKIMQIKIRNTGHRFRFQTLSQKYGSYNTYWRRTMRAIEQGKYTRHLAKAGRRAAAQGKEMPPELRASLPKRLREKLERDRKKIAERHGVETEEAGEETAPEAAAEQPEPVRQPKNQVFELNESELDDFDIDAMFSAIKSDESGKGAAVPAPGAPPVRSRSAPDRPPAARAASRPGPAAPAGRAAASGRRPAAPAARAEAGARRAATAPGPGTPPPRPTGQGTARPTPVRRASAPRRVQPGAKPGAKPGVPSGMTEQQTQDLYKRFVQAKKLVGADTSKLSYDRLLKTLNKQAPKIMEQHKAKGVKFDVVIKDDGVVLKAKPVKS